MRKIINSKTIPFLVIICSVIGLALRLWTIGDGADAFGLYAPKPLAWTVLWVFTAVVVAMIVFANWPLKKTGSYEENYPKSLFGMIGNVLAGIGVVLYSLPTVIGDTLPGGSFLFYSVPWVDITGQPGIPDLITGIGGLAAGGILIVLGVFRFLGKKPNFLLHGVLCLYFALRLFNRCRFWSDEPQVGVIVLPFLASLTLMLASYQRTCFDVDLGNRRSSLLWSLLGVYLCVLALPSMEEIFFYGGCALWLLSDLCSLRPVKRTETAAPQTVVKEVEEQEPACRPEEMSTEEPENWLDHPQDQ